MVTAQPSRFVDRERTITRNGVGDEDGWLGCKCTQKDPRKPGRFGGWDPVKGSDERCGGPGEKVWRWTVLPRGSKKSLNFPRKRVEQTAPPSEAQAKGVPIEAP